MNTLKIYIQITSMLLCGLCLAPETWAQTQDEAKAYNTAAAAYNQGIELINANRNREAVSSLTRAIEQLPRKSFAYRVLADSFYSRGLAFIRLKGLPDELERPRFSWFRVFGREQSDAAG